MHRVGPYPYRGKNHHTKEEPNLECQNSKFGHTYLFFFTLQK